MAITEIRNVYCKDEKVGDVLRALSGLVLKPPIAVPVINAVFKGGEIIAEHANAGTPAEMFIEHLRKTKPERVTTADLKVWCKANGRAVSYAGFIRNLALEAKAIKRTSRGVFAVLVK